MSDQLNFFESIKKFEKINKKNNASYEKYNKVKRELNDIEIIIKENILFIFVDYRVKFIIEEVDHPGEVDRPLVLRFHQWSDQIIFSDHHDKLPLIFENDQR